MPVVEIEGLGKIQFPDAMSQVDIDRAIKNEILPMVAQRVPSAMIAGLSSDAAAGGNPFTKGTAKADIYWKLGDRYRYRVVDILTKIEEPQPRGGIIKEITDNEVIYGNGRATDLLGNLIRNPRGQTFVNNQVFVDEYRVGRKWTTIFRGTRRDYQEDEWTMDMKVVTRESVTVPAGTFQCFRVEGRGTMRDRGARVEINYWIAPERVRPFIAYEHITAKGLRRGANERWELVAFQQR